MGVGFCLSSCSTTCTSKNVVQNHDYACMWAEDSTEYSLLLSDLWTVKHYFQGLTKSASARSIYSIG